MNHRILRLIAVLVVCTAVLPSIGFTTLGQSTAAQDNATPKLDVVPDRYVVLLAEGQFTSSAAAALQFDRIAGAEVDYVYDTAFAGFAGTFTPAAARTLMQDPAIAGVYPDVRATVQGQSLQPGINRVDADYNPTKAGNGSGTVDVDVAVIDTGVGPHADLTVAGGRDCLFQGSLRDYYGHGTHVAGIIAAKDNDFGVVGVAPGARIWSVRVLDQYGNGSLSSVICGMEWVAQHAATIEVANMSLGLIVSDYGSGCTSSPTHRAICAMTNAGVTVMAAACNAGIDASTCSPGRYPEVISVSAFAEWDGKPGGHGGCKSTPDGFYGCDDRRASFSNYGATVDIASIGVGVYSTLFDNRYGYWSGTSMATPHVTGGAALLIAQQGDISPAKVRERLLLVSMSGPVPGDFDAYPEPILNVASLGAGSMEIPSSAKPGQQIRIKVGDVIPKTIATYRLNGVVIGTANVTTNGNAYLTYRLPETPYGKYEVKVTNHRKTITKNILIRPLLALSDKEAHVGETVTASLSGFGANDSVLLTMETGPGTRNLDRVNTSAVGSASASFVLPSSTDGNHRITATDESGDSTYVSIKTLPSMSAPTIVGAGEWLPVQLRGFAAGESVELRWGSSTGSVLRTKVVTATGSGDVNVQIPDDASNGPHSLWAVGDAGNRDRITVTTFSEATESTATATSTSTVVTPTPTPTVPVFTETVTATEPPATPTETTTSEPTAEPTVTSTHVEPTAEAPTETVMPEQTATA